VPSIAPRASLEEWVEFGILALGVKRGGKGGLLDIDIVEGLRGGGLIQD